MQNIAGDFDQNPKLDLFCFALLKHSNSEVKSQRYVTFDNQYIPTKQWDIPMNLLDELKEPLEDQ